jgi:hypothetical protein
MTRTPLHYCDRCREKSEVWKRTLDGKHFSYCITPGCEKKHLDKIESCSSIVSITPENNGKIGTTQMTYQDAEILIAEGRKLGYRGTDWEQSFLQRLEAMQPVFLLPEDAASVTEFYRRATGGGFRTGKDHGVVYDSGGW